MNFKKKNFLDYKRNKVQHLFSLFTWHFTNKKKKINKKFLSKKALIVGSEWQCTIINRSIIFTKAFAGILFACHDDRHVWLTVANDCVCSLFMQRIQFTCQFSSLSTSISSFPLRFKCLTKWLELIGSKFLQENF